MLRLATLAALLVSGCTPRLGASPVSPNTSTEPVSVPGVPAAAAEASAVLNGTVTYRERVALPPGTVLRVRVEDVSGAPASTVAVQTIRPAAQVPLPFALAYNPARVDVGHRYAVRAEIRDEDGRLLWATTEGAPVFTQGAPIDGVEVVLHPAHE